MDNIGQIVVSAATNHQDSPASQAYLWVLSRLDMAKFVQRSVIARRTPMVTRMIVARIMHTDRLPCGMPVYRAVQMYNVCNMLSRVLGSTFVYLRKNEIVIEWNGVRRNAIMMKPHWEHQMDAAYHQEQDVRMEHLRQNDPAEAEEYMFNIQEQIEDRIHEASLLARM